MVVCGTLTGEGAALTINIMEKKKKDWDKFFEDGQGFHKTVRGSLKRPGIFTPEIVQNVAAMGIEKYFMLIFTNRGTLPRNHTMHDFVNDFMIIKPKREDVQLFVDAIDRVALFAEQELSTRSLTHQGTAEPGMSN